MNKRRACHFTLCIFVGPLGPSPASPPLPPRPCPQCQEYLLPGARRRGHCPRPTPGGRRTPGGRETAPPTGGPGIGAAAARRRGQAPAAADAVSARKAPPAAPEEQTARAGGGERAEAGRGAARERRARGPRLCSRHPTHVLVSAKCRAGAQSQLRPGEPRPGARRSSALFCLLDPKDRGSRTTRKHPKWHRR